VDVSYLQTVLNLSQGAARNLLPNLKAAGLIDERGQPTQRAMEWREDEQYTKVCQDIRQEVYAQALLDALPPPNPGKEQVERWFARETQTGQANAQKMAAFYLLLCEGDASASEQGGEKRDGQQPAAARPVRRAVRGEPRRQREALPSTQETVRSNAPARQALQQPVVHLDINIHIDSTASPDQIEQIFASMERHLYKREGQS